MSFALTIAFDFYIGFPLLYSLNSLERESCRNSKIVVDFSSGLHIGESFMRWTVLFLFIE